ncbi:hypothetical protein [Candidatus Protochlamydia amoebophila]|uniref:Uncharacterized protein n=1 Tax=Candidatus Protochlamydia amoebophila TaxID=362787 RepID=A0A0C1JVF9_9BACT|nr:hypothetical protein [Candidatus Protochlamydia amoebophila]KIC74396.1 hypothetical protein DB44_AL00900 [Candidatus Protochlamydia amoebophila]
MSSPHIQPVPPSSSNPASTLDPKRTLPKKPTASSTKKSGGIFNPFGFSKPSSSSSSTTKKTESIFTNVNPITQSNKASAQKPLANRRSSISSTKTESGPSDFIDRKVKRASSKQLPLTQETQSSEVVSLESVQAELHNFAKNFTSTLSLIRQELQQEVDELPEEFKNRINFATGFALADSDNGLDESKLAQKVWKRLDSQWKQLASHVNTSQNSAKSRRLSFSPDDESIKKLTESVSKGIPSRSDVAKNLESIKDETQHGNYICNVYYKPLCIDDLSENSEINEVSPGYLTSAKCPTITLFTYMQHLQLVAQHFSNLSNIPPKPSFNDKNLKDLITKFIESLNNKFKKTPRDIVRFCQQLGRSVHLYVEKLENTLYITYKEPVNKAGADYQQIANRILETITSNDKGSWDADMRRILCSYGLHIKGLALPPGLNWEKELQEHYFYSDKLNLPDEFKTWLKQQFNEKNWDFSDVEKTLSNLKSVHHKVSNRLKKSLKNFLTLLMQGVKLDLQQQECIELLSIMGSVEKEKVSISTIFTRFNEVFSKISESQNSEIKKLLPFLQILRQDMLISIHRETENAWRFIRGMESKFITDLPESNKKVNIKWDDFGSKICISRDAQLEGHPECILKSSITISSTEEGAWIVLPNLEITSPKISDISFKERYMELIVTLKAMGLPYSEIIA